MEFPAGPDFELVGLRSHQGGDGRLKGQGAMFTVPPGLLWQRPSSFVSETEVAVIGQSEAWMAGLSSIL